MTATAADQLLAGVAGKMPNYGSVQYIRSLNNVMAETASKLAYSWSAGPWTAEQSQRFSTVLTEAVASSSSDKKKHRREK